MNLTATHLNTQVTVTASSIQKLLAQCGINSRAFYKAGKPEVFAGWKITVPEDARSLLHYSKSLRNNQPKRGHLVNVLKDGQIVAQFNSASQAAAHIGTDASTASKLARGVRKTINGYSLQYVDSSGHSEAQRNRFGKSLFIRKDGREWRFLNSVQAAAFLGCHVEFLRRSIREGRDEVFGFEIEVRKDREAVEEWVTFYQRYFASYNAKPDKRRWSKLTRQELIDLTETNSFKELWNQYEHSGYQPYERPCLDRKNPAEGYTLDNIQILTSYENILKIAEDRRVLAGYTWFISDNPTKGFIAYSHALAEFKERGLFKIPLAQRPHIDLLPNGSFPCTT